MKPSFVRRTRRRGYASKESGKLKKESHENTFFASSTHDPFFPMAVNRKCAECEAEEKAQRAPEKKEEEKLMKAANQEEAKLMKAGEKKEEEKLQKAPEAKEEEKVMKAGEKEEEKLQKAAGPEEEKKVQKKEASATVAKTAGQYISTLHGKGQRLSPEVNAFYSQRFGYDFSEVKIHTDREAAHSAKELRAKAYTVGKNIVFNEGQYDTTSALGKHLLAHELTHVVQQNNLQRTADVQRVDYDECNAAERTIVRRCHDRARTMMWHAIVKLFSYHKGGTAPDVVAALRNRFAGTSRSLAGLVAFNMFTVYRNSDDPTYECEKPQDGNTLGWSMWCVPFTDIELYPLWFGLPSDDERAETIIHEWMHRYGCLLDLGYHEGGTSGGHGTIRSLNNADAYSNLCFDLK